nr:AP2/ERF domain-containing protein [Tanacetum cinerariifolium]
MGEGNSESGVWKGRWPWFGSGQSSMHKINHILGHTYEAGRTKIDPTTSITLRTQKPFVHPPDWSSGTPLQKIKKARLIINLTLGLHLSLTNTTTCPCTTTSAKGDVEMTNFKCTYVLSGGISLTKEYAQYIADIVLLWAEQIDPETLRKGEYYNHVKEYQKKDKIGSKPDKNGKRGEAGKSQKQLQWIKKEKLKKMQKEGPEMQSPTSYIDERRKEGLNFTTFSSNSLLEEFTDELALITYPPDYDDNHTCDIESVLRELEFCFTKDFSKDDDLPSPDNEDKVFNPRILIHGKSVKIITRFAQAKKLAISYASLLLKDFDPP